MQVGEGVAVASSASQSKGPEPSESDVEDLGIFHAVLFDSLGDVPLAQRPYSITRAGTEEVAYAGVLDEQGALRHEDVPSGDYELRIGSSRRAILVLDPGDTRRQVQFVRE